jgi:hypothetical protein
MTNWKMIELSIEKNSDPYNSNEQFVCLDFYFPYFRSLNVKMHRVVSWTKF